MIVYHGSTEIVSKPSILIPNRTMDYGTGFYTTSSFLQAENWARRRMSSKKLNYGYVNVYDFSADNALNTLSFDGPSDEWIDFVMRNRTIRGFSHDYDLVCGPVANDRVYAAFALFEGGILDKKGLIAELKTYELVDQYLFHTEKALSRIKFVRAEEVRI